MMAKTKQQTGDDDYEDGNGSDDVGGNDGPPSCDGVEEGSCDASDNSDCRCW